MDKPKTRPQYSLEVRDRAVRMVFDHAREHPSQWAAISSIASKIGCSAATLHAWVRQSERDSGRRPGLTTEMADRLKALERENRELRQANEILRKASAYFAQGIDLGRSSTADTSHDRVHRRSSRYPRGRADLCGIADRPVDVSYPRGAAG